MLAARASMPVSIREGMVMNAPPPASAFCVPAQRAARNSTTNVTQAGGLPVSLTRMPGAQRVRLFLRIKTGAQLHLALRGQGLEPGERIAYGVLQGTGSKTGAG